MIKINCNKDAIERAVKILGNNQALAEKLEVSYTCVLHWKSGKNNPTMANCIKIEKATDGLVTRKDIFPDYPWDKMNVSKES